MDTTGRRARALRSILSLTFLLSILAVTHASASCRRRASSALTSDGVLRSSALDQASVSWTSKAAWTCVRVLWWRRRGRRVDGAAMASTRAPPRSRTSCACYARRRPRRRRRPGKGPRRRGTRLVCVARDGRRAVVVGPGRRSSYLLLHVRRDARACDARSEVLGQAVRSGEGARGGCPFLVRRGARGGGGAGRSYGSPPPMVVACRARKGSLSAAFTHEPCSCGSPAPRPGSVVAPTATSIRCSSAARYGSGAADVAFRPAPPRRGRPHAIDAQLPSP